MSHVPLPGPHRLHHLGGQRLGPHLRDQLEPPQASDDGLRCFLSLETYMACGYGVCNGCTVEVQGPRFAGWPYSRTCMEGPVYEACELVQMQHG
jgi:dihydroorotate dehydrogenase electron transfer subunit